MSIQDGQTSGGRYEEPISNRRIAASLIAAAALGAFGLLISSTGHAAPLTLADTTVQGSDGNQYPYIGAPYQTTGLSFTQNNGIDTLSAFTAFSGTDNVNGYSISYADFFIGDYAIVLGDEVANGGISVAGIYQIGKNGTYETSQDIWSGRSGIIYGAGYNYNNNLLLSPTVLTSGKLLEGISVTDTLLQNGTYDLSISFKDFVAFDIAMAEHGVFWGTGDCANGAVLGFPGSGIALPEPAAFSLMGVGLLALGATRMRRRRRGGDPVALALG